MRPNLRRPNRYMGRPESQPIHAFNTLILQEFSKVSVFCNWLLRASPTKRTCCYRELRRNRTGFLIARSESNRCEVVGLLVPRTLAWPAAACHLNLTQCGDTKPSMRRDVSDWNVKF